MSGKYKKYRLKERSNTLVTVAQEQKWHKLQHTWLDKNDVPLIIKVHNINSTSGWWHHAKVVVPTFRGNTWPSFETTATQHTSTRCQHPKLISTLTMTSRESLKSVTTHNMVELTAGGGTCR